MTPLSLAVEEYYQIFVKRSVGGEGDYWYFRRDLDLMKQNAIVSDVSVVR